jgi:PAS domain S-box-containing protein
MLSSSKKSNPENKQFIAPPVAPYLIKTDAAGNILSTCKKFDEFLYYRSITNSREINIADIFARLCPVSPLQSEDIAKKGFPELFDLSINGPSTEHTCIRWMATPVFLDHPLIKGWQLTGMEIPSKKNKSMIRTTEQTRRLQKEKDLSDLIINSMPGIFYLFDGTGKFLRWNKRLELVSGYDYYQISTMTPTDFFSETEKAYITSRINTAFEIGISDAESILMTSTGQEIPHYFTAQLITYEGKPCLIGMGIDISERIRAEEKTKLSNERYMLATRATNDAIWDWDIKQSSPFRGEGFFTQFGYQPSDEIYVKGFWKSHIHPADRDRVIDSMENFIARKGDGLWSEEYRFRKANGEYATVADRGFLVFDEAGMVKRVVGSMQDITEKKKLEQKLIQQELNKQKIVAQAMIEAQENERAEIGKELHDNVNQILSTGKLYLELFKSDHSDPSHLLELCLGNINHAIQEIRNISRALIPSAIVDLGLQDSIQDLIETIKLTRSLHVEFHTRSWTEEKISNHQKLMLFRIIQEQANNVIKHAEARNLVMELSMDHVSNQVILEIADDGKGFDPEKIKKGLGLSNIMSRADMFGGKTTIVSATGKGCQLSVQIPIHNFSKPY